MDGHGVRKKWFLCIVIAIFCWDNAHNQRNRDEFRFSKVYSTTFELTWIEEVNVTYGIVVQKDSSVSKSDCLEEIGNVKSGVIRARESNGNPLEALTTYHAILCGINAENFSFVVAVNHAITGPPAPYSITTSSNNPNLLDVRWEDRCAVVNTDIECKQQQVADVYTITYQAAGGTKRTATVKDGGNATAAPPRQITLNNLMSNSKYTLTIQIKGRGEQYEVFSDVSQPATGYTIPGQPQNAEETCDATINTKQICINWMKPDGGEAINQYVVQWSRADGSTDSKTLNHVRGQLIYKYIINELLPGEKIVFNITAKNKAGQGRSLQRSFITNPSPPTITSHSRTANSLTINWRNPSLGRFDGIVVESDSNEFKKATFPNQSTSHTISGLKPGKKYTVIIYTLLMDNEDIIKSDKVTFSETKENNLGFIASVMIGSIVAVIFIVVGLAYLKHHCDVAKSNQSRISRPPRFATGFKTAPFTPVTTSQTFNSDQKSLRSL